MLFYPSLSCLQNVVISSVESEPLTAENVVTTDSLSSSSGLVSEQSSKFYDVSAMALRRLLVTNSVILINRDLNNLAKIIRVHESLFNLNLNNNSFANVFNTV